MSVHLIDINVSADMDEYPSLHFQDIRKNPKCHGVNTDRQMDGWTDGRENSFQYNYIFSY